MSSNSKDNNRGSAMQIGLFVCATLLFAGGIGLGFYGEPISASATLGAGILCLIFAFLSKFKRFKGLGIEAELWEDKQKEAAELIETLRSLAAITARQLISINARMGRWGTGIPRDEQRRVVEQLEQVLKEAGVPITEREEMKSEYNYWNAFDMGRLITDKINLAIREKGKQQEKILASFDQPIKDIEGFRKANERRQEISAQEVEWDQIRDLAPHKAFYEAFEKIIDRADCLSADEKDELRESEEMKDLYVWITERRIRRPDFWFRDPKLRGDQGF